LVETVRTADGPWQRTLCHLGEPNGSAQARWLKTIENFNADGKGRQLQLFSSLDDPAIEHPYASRFTVFALNHP
jgi:hypothetical protein